MYKVKSNTDVPVCPRSAPQAKFAPLKPPLRWRSLITKRREPSSSNSKFATPPALTVVLGMAWLPLRIARRSAVGRTKDERSGWCNNNRDFNTSLHECYYHYISLFAWNSKTKSFPTFFPSRNAQASIRIQFIQEHKLPEKKRSLLGLARFRISAQRFGDFFRKGAGLDESRSAGRRALRRFLAVLVKSIIQYFAAFTDEIRSEIARHRFSCLSRLGLIKML